MTITKQWLQQAINEMETARDDIPFGLDEHDAKVLAALKQMLAGMEAEPVMYTVTFEGEIEEIGGDCQSFKSEDCQLYIECLCDEDNHEGYAVTPLYTAPQPLTDAELEQYRKAAGESVECAQIKQVADLCEMQFDDGRTCAFHTDAEKAIQWLNACDGNKVREYVKLEKFQSAMLQSGDTPIIPDGPEWTNAQCLEFLTVAFRHNEISGDIEFDDIRLGVKSALAAAPQQE